MARFTKKIRRTTARLPRGTLMALVMLGLLVLAVGAARADDSRGGRVAPPFNGGSGYPGWISAAGVGATPS
ncbi:MAG: hypothetical protein KIT36_20875 [Alphaproteobacteria bacterium]|nr:hypothetical protein [Alphaproteobacteria bacterium]